MTYTHLSLLSKENEASSSGDQTSQAANQGEMSGLMGVLKSAMSIGDKDELTLSEFVDSAMSYAKGDVPEMVMVLDKEEIEHYKRASRIEKVIMIVIPYYFFW